MSIEQGLRNTCLMLDERLTRLLTCIKRIGLSYPFLHT